MWSVTDYRAAAIRAARKYGLDSDVFVAQLTQESGLNPGAVSPAGASGIAQFIPATAKRYNVNLNDGLVTDDLEGAARYMRDNLKATGGSYAKALSLYNSGRADAYKNPNFANGETYNYVKKILAAAGGQPSSRATPGPTSRTTYTPGTSSFTPDTTSAGAGLSDILAASLSSQKQAVAPATQLEAPSFSSSRYVQGAALPQAAAPMAAAKLDVGAAISALEAAPPVASVKTTPGSTSTTRVDPVGLPVPASGTQKGASAAVNFARNHLGGYSESSGSNRGPQLDQLEARFGLSGAAWCAMFTSVAVTRGGAPKSARTASVADVYRSAVNGGGGYEKGLKAAPRAGDLMIFGRSQHIGLVEKVNRDGTVTTIEGNTSSGKVQRVTRAADSGDFARPKYR